MLLERYGVVSRAAAHAEDQRGGFAASYGVLKTMEESGRVRRGHFVGALEGAQFALPGAVDRIRDARDAQDGEVDVRVVAAVDPANPFGALLPWPATTEVAGRPRRVSGARVVFVDGAPVLYAASNDRSLLTFPAAHDRDAFASALRAWIEAPRSRALVLERVDGATPDAFERRTILEECGFGASYRGWVLREAIRRA